MLGFRRHDQTDFVTTRLAAPASNYGVRLSQEADAEHTYYFVSSEANGLYISWPYHGPDNRPCLEITLDSRDIERDRTGGAGRARGQTEQSLPPDGGVFEPLLRHIGGLVRDDDHVGPFAGGVLVIGALARKTGRAGVAALQPVCADRTDVASTQRCAEARVV